MNPSTNTQIAVHQPGGFDLSPRNFEEAWRFADMLANSELAPKDFKGKPGNCMIAMQWGAELGLKAIQAIQNIAVINGRPALWGDSVIALVRSSPLCEFVIETEDATSSTCRVKRRGEPEQSRTFTDQDAEKAGLKGKAGPWAQYPKRMRQMRARAFALRDVFPDVLRGLPVAEEIMDMPTERHMGAVEEVKPAAPALPSLPGYSAEEFESKLPEWQKLVTGQDGKTAQGLLAKLTTKRSFTEEQKARILSIKPAAAAAPAPAPAPAEAPPPDPGIDPAHADFVAQLEAGEVQQ